MTIRPIFRVAVAGLDDRDVRLIEIVFKHSLYNRYDFQLLDQADPLRTDILIVNPALPAGLDALAALRAHSREIPSISALPRGAQAAARHAITIDRLTLQLLPTLNRVVEIEGLEARSARQGAGGERAADVLAATTGAGGIGELFDRSIPMVANRIEIDSDQFLPPAAADRPGPSSGQDDDLVDALVLDVPFADAEQAAFVAGPRSTAAPHAAEAGPSEPARVAPAGVRWHPVDTPAWPEPAIAGSRAQPSMADAATAVMAGEIAVRPLPLPSTPAILAGQSYGEVAGHHPATGPGADVCSVQVLVVDPSLAAQQQLTRALRSGSLQVQCVASAAAALQCAAQRQYDLVITEYGLSDVSGFHLIAALRQRAGYRTTPILLLRSRTGLLDGARARLHGDVMLLTKPLTRVELQVVVADVLRRSVALDELQTLFDDPPL